MKKLFCQLCVLAGLSLTIFNSAHAGEGVGHGGGGEFNVIKCNASISARQRLSLLVCLTGDTNAQGRYEIIPCGSEKIGYVSIDRYTLVTANSAMKETVHIPSLLFTVDWTENRFSLQMNHPIAGRLNLIRLGNESVDKGTRFDLDLPAMKHSLTNMSCKFDSN